MVGIQGMALGTLTGLNSVAGHAEIYSLFSTHLSALQTQHDTNWLSGKQMNLRNQAQETKLSLVLMYRVSLQRNQTLENTPYTCCEKQTLQCKDQSSLDRLDRTSALPGAVLQPPADLCSHCSVLGTEANLHLPFPRAFFGSSPSFASTHCSISKTPEFCETSLK